MVERLERGTREGGFGFRFHRRTDAMEELTRNDSSRSMQRDDCRLRFTRSLGLNDRSRRKGSHAGAGHVKYLHFVVICVTRCIYNKSVKLKRRDRESFHNLKRKGISGTVGGERFEIVVAAYITYKYIPYRFPLRIRCDSRFIVDSLDGRRSFDLLEIFSSSYFVRLRVATS